jgi:hypothetical protein
VSLLIAASMSASAKTMSGFPTPPREDAEDALRQARLLTEFDELQCGAVPGGASSKTTVLPPASAGEQNGHERETAGNDAGRPVVHEVDLLGGWVQVRSLSSTGPDSRAPIGTCQGHVGSEECPTDG